MLRIELAPNEKVRQTIGLDYRYDVKTQSFGSEEYKVRVSTYELGGGRILSNLLSSPLCSSNLSEMASICIVLDLSKKKAGNCVESLLFWLTQVRKCVNKSLAELKA